MPLGDGEVYVAHTVACAMFVVRTASGALFDWTLVPSGAATYDWNLHAPIWISIRR